MRKFKDFCEKVGVRERSTAFVEKAEEFIEDHGTGILYTLICGGAVVIYGQTIRYMHYVNKFAKHGIFQSSIFGLKN